jgi:MarR family transcriptional regulator for hemolysin
MSSPPTETLGFLINDVARLLRRQFDKALAEAGLGLSPAEARALAYGARYPGLRQSELADRMSIEPMTLVGFLDRLEAKGLVERIADPQDRRVKQVRLLPSAEPLVGRIVEIATAVRTEASAGLKESEVDRIRAALVVMRGNLAAAGKDAAA